MAGRTWHSLPEYEALRALMESGTTSKAALRLGLSQSAISRSISSLEARLGRILFERDGGRLRPTLEATQLNRRLDPLFEALDRIDGPTEPTQETLRLTAPPTYAHRFLVGHIATFLQANPHFYVSLEVNSAEDVIRRVQDDRSDLGMSGVDLTREGIKLTPYRYSEAACAMPSGHELADLDVIQAQDLHNQPLIALSRRHSRRAQLERVLTNSRSFPKIVAEASTSFAAVDLAREGLGVTVVNPFPVAQYRSEDVVFRRFASPIEYRTYFVTSDHKPTPAIARAFIRHLRLHTPKMPFTKPT